MNNLSQREMIYGGLAVAGVIAAIYLLAGGARTLSRAAGELPGEVIGGAVEGIGLSLGVPLTDDELCTQDLAAGRTWEASFSCPATRWIREGLF